MSETMEIQMAEVKTDISYLKKGMDSIESKIDSFHIKFDSYSEFMKKEYVTKEEFSTVKSIVYGFVGLVLISVVGAIIGLVILK